MSWQDYIDNYIVNFTDQNKGATAYNICESGALCGNSDGTIWASTPGFKLGNESVEVEKDDGSGTYKTNINEFNNLVNAFSNNGVCTAVGGIRLNGEKYFIVSFDEHRQILYLKKSGGGAAVAKSGLAFAIGIFSSSKKLKNFHGQDEPQNPGMTNRVVEELQAFLTANNL
jgi:hypothetical protein